jgi:SSS family solute:Na+ symporter
MLASGARLMLAAVPLCMLVLDRPANEITVGQMIIAILAIGFVGTFYTVFGGIRTVIWVDTIQFVLVVGAALLTIGLLLHRIHAPVGDIFSALHDAGKTKVFDVSTDPKKPFTLWTAIFGGLLVNMAAFGVDHDLAQRFLVAKSPARGAISVIASQVIGMAVVACFLLIGLLLYVFYNRPDLTGFTPQFALPAAELSGATYQWFLIKELPPVLSGLAMAGLFAVSQGSMDSAINALASSAVADVYVPWRRHRAGLPSAAEMKRGFEVITSQAAAPPAASAAPPSEAGEAPLAAPKVAVAGMGVVMTAFAIGCAYVYDPKQKAFLDFALGVLNFAFSGMLAVFLTALLTRRGNNKSVVLALLTGVVVVALTQDSVLGGLTEALTGTRHTLAFTWAMPIATGLAFLVCVAGAPAVARGVWSARS